MNQVTPKFNLNSIEPETDGSNVRNRDNSILTGGTRVYFRNLVPHLLEHIGEADVVVGCVAWLTHPEILEALSSKSAAIVVQKEDFLRPDIGTDGQWKLKLRAQYQKIKCSSSRYAFHNMVGSLSYASDPTIDGVRCVGNYNREKSPAFPRMHNKFLVFCKYDNSTEEEAGAELGISPYAVWTGSFNLTFNAQNSLENAIYLSDPAVAEAYFSEFGQIMALSEPLDWESEWSAPEWRIGS